jgi:hypothetical protein
VPENGKLEKLRQYCVANGHLVFAGDRVSLETAAKILNIKPGTLRNWRYLDHIIPHKGKKTILG